MREASASCDSQHAQNLNLDSQSEILHHSCDDRAGGFFVKSSTCPPAEEATLDLITSKFLRDKQQLPSRLKMPGKNKKKKGKGKSGNKKSVSGKTVSTSPSSTLISKSRAHYNSTPESLSDDYSSDVSTRSRSRSRSRSCSRSQPRSDSCMHSCVSSESVNIPISPGNANAGLLLHNNSNHNNATSSSTAIAHEEPLTAENKSSQRK